MKVFRKIAKKCKEEILEVFSKKLLNTNYIFVLLIFIHIQNGGDFEVLITILRGLEKLLRSKVDSLSQPSRQRHESSDDDDSDDEHDRAQKRLLSQELKTHKESESHEILDELIRQRDTPQEQENQSSETESENETRNNESETDDESRKRKYKREGNNGDNGVPEPYQKLSRDLRGLKSHNLTPPELSLKISKSENTHKQTSSSSSSSSSSCSRISTQKR
jgi:hypothetical protein